MHERKDDVKSDADSLILFIDYLCRRIHASKSYFDISDFIRHFSDGAFPPRTDYAESIVKRIPQRRILEVLTTALSDLESIQIQNARYLLPVLISRMNDDDKSHTLSILNDQLLECDDESLVIFVAACLPQNWWTQLDTAARLRAEYYMILSVRSGRASASLDDPISGALGTWAPRLFPHILSTTEYEEAIVHLLESNKRTVQQYFCWYQLPYLHKLYDKPTTAIKHRIRMRLRHGDARIRSRLNELLVVEEPPKWAEAFDDALSNFSEGASPGLNEYDDDTWDDQVPF